MTTLSLKSAQRRLTVLWVTAFLALGAILVVQTLVDHYAADMVGPIWKWFASTLLPTTTLAIGALVAQEQVQRSVKNPPSVGIVIYRIAWWLSFAYLVVAFAAIVGQPIAATRGKSPLDLVAVLSYALTAIQSLLGGVLGYFFVKSR